MRRQTDTGGVDAASEVGDTAQRMLETVAESLPRIGVAAAMILFGWLIAKAVRALLERWLRRRNTASFARVMSKVAGWLVLAAAALAAVVTLFPSVRPVDLLAGLGIFSVAVGFAFQDILENTLAGVLLLFRQPFRAGDQVEVHGHTGSIEAITIRETRLRTFDGQLVLVPNRDVYKNVIRVQTHYDARRVAFVVGIAYENDAGLAREVVTSTLSDLELVEADPAPEALICELSGSTVDIEARFWTDPRQHEAQVALSRAIEATKAALDSAGIEMPADIIALQATPSFKTALQGDGDVTPGGGVAR